MPDDLVVRHIGIYANRDELLVAVDNTSVASPELISVLAATGVEYVPLGENCRVPVFSRRREVSPLSLCNINGCRLSS